MDGQVTWSDLGFSFGRTLSEHSAATEEKTSQPCWKKLRVSQNQDFLYLDCRKSGNGQRPEPLTVMGGLSLGELTTLKTGEKPSETAVQEMLSVWGPHSVAEESRLSQILEVNPLPKYNLTAKACLGILRRAERRGKDLPKLLKQVLLMQSASGGGCDGGGKGALVQTEKSGTLGTGNDQTIFCLQGNGIDRADTAGCNGKGWKADESYTLNTIHRPAVCAYSFDSLASNSMKSKNPNSGCRETEIAKTLDTTNPDPSKNQGGIAVVALDMTHACDVIRECGEQVPALQARMGTGGNQVPRTYQDVTGTLSPGAHAGSYNGQDAYNDMLVCGVTSDAAHTLRAKANCKQRGFKDGTDLVCSSVDCRNSREGGEINGTLQAKESGGQSLNLNNTVRQNMVVRRLTPMECERLQGFPDHWTDIGEWIDEKGKKHKDADSPRYKALGNSIALPFWDWMLRRMARYLPDDATLGSLFDGIAGFPLIWERIHGKGTARWASEIEPFPIAVTKKRFGEE